MIEHQILQGRNAVVAYFTNKFEPADKDSAQLVKITFEDNHQTMWLVPPPKGQ